MGVSWRPALGSSAVWPGGVINTSAILSAATSAKLGVKPLAESREPTNACKPWSLLTTNAHVAIRLTRSSSTTCKSLFR